MVLIWFSPKKSTKNVNVFDRAKSSLSISSVRFLKCTKGKVFKLHHSDPSSHQILHNNRIEASTFKRSVYYMRLKNTQMTNQIEAKYLKSLWTVEVAYKLGEVWVETKFGELFFLDCWSISRKDSTPRFYAQPKSSNPSFDL